jgi:hypothetical protein
VFDIARSRKGISCSASSNKRITSYLRPGKDLSSSAKRYSMDPITSLTYVNLRIDQTIAGNANARILVMFMMRQTAHGT